MEDEGHLIIQCEDSCVTTLRTELLWRAQEVDDTVDESIPTLGGTKVIAKLLHSRTVLLPRIIQRRGGVGCTGVTKEFRGPIH